MVMLSEFQIRHYGMEITNAFFSPANIFILHMVSVKDVQRPLIASHLMGLDSYFKFYCLRVSLSHA